MLQHPDERTSTREQRKPGVCVCVREEGEQLMERKEVCTCEGEGGALRCHSVVSLTQLVNNDGVSLAGVPTLLQPSHILHWDPVEHRQHTWELTLTFVLQHKALVGFLTDQIQPTS